jgi:hypothetical protein
MKRTTSIRRGQATRKTPRRKPRVLPLDVLIQRQSIYCLSWLTREFLDMPAAGILACWALTRYVKDKRLPHPPTVDYQSTAWLAKTLGWNEHQTEDSLWRLKHSQGFQVNADRRSILLNPERLLSQLAEMVFAGNSIGADYGNRQLREACKAWIQLRAHAKVLHRPPLMENGASRIADWCVRHKSPAVSKHVLTFFEPKDEALLAFAVTFFARTDDPESKPQMLAVLKHKTPEIRATVVPAIRFLCTPKETAGYLVPLLHDPSKQVILAALLEANWVSQEIPPGELTRLLKDPDPEIRRMAAYALECCRNPAVVDPLLEATKDAIASVRAQAAVSLGRIGTPKAYDRLIELLGDGNAEVRHDAINGLRWLEDMRAIPHLQKLLKEEKDRDTRNMAERTIRELKSKHSPFPFW